MLKIHKIVQAHAFQQLESLWRQIEHWARVTDRTALRIELLSIPDKIMCDAFSTLLHQRLYIDRFMQSGGHTPVVLGILSNHLPMSKLSSIANRIHCIILVNQLTHPLHPFIYTVEDHVLLRSANIFEKIDSVCDYCWGYAYLNIIVVTVFNYCIYNQSFQSLHIANQHSRHQPTISYHTGQPSLQAALIVCLYTRRIKQLLRTKIGGTCTRLELQDYLNHWLNDHTSSLTPSHDHPFKYAMIKLTETNEKNSYACSLTLGIHEENTLFNTEFILIK